jgi:hypothetical protein
MEEDEAAVAIYAECDKGDSLCNLEQQSISFSPAFVSGLPNERAIVIDSGMVYLISLLAIYQEGIAGSALA